MKRILIGVAAVMLVALMSGPVFAGSQTDAKIAVHLQAHATKGDACALDPATLGTPCSNYVVSGELNTSYDLYLMVANGDSLAGVGGLSCGIAYNGGACGAAAMSDGVGVDVYNWTLCTSGLEFTNGCTAALEDEWPASQGGNRITWNSNTDCQRSVIGGEGVQTCAGFFYVFAYSKDFFAITPNNNLASGPGELQVGDCSNAVSDILVTSAGNVWFSGDGSQGCNPCTDLCEPIAVENTTWGKMKQRY